MKKEDVGILAHLLTLFKDVVLRMEKAQKEKNLEELNALKNEALSVQQQIDEMI